MKCDSDLLRAWQWAFTRQLRAVGKMLSLIRRFFFCRANCVSAVEKASMHQLWLNRRPCPTAESLIPWVGIRMRSCIFKKVFERTRISSFCTA